MAFQSLGFIFLFLPLVLAGYFLINRFGSLSAGKAWLIAASLFFYGSWNLIFVPILLFSVATNYAVSRRLAPERSNRRFFLGVGIVFNVMLLAYFKYANFFITSADAFFSAGWPTLQIVFPIGISFFSLQQIAFLVDGYEGLTVEKSFLDYLLFTTFFPYLLAGPIAHRQEIMPQFTAKKAAADSRNLVEGLVLFSIGLFKKVMLADFLSMWVTSLHTNPVLPFADAWMVSLAYTLELYFDFSGYSDMAIGLGLLFNIVIPINFNSPLKATTIVEFWRRWHITLANFMRTYVFTAMLRARASVTFGYSLWASFVTMLLMGIWHGAGWNYILFGAMHGAAVVVYSVWAKLKIKLPKPLAWFLLFNFINLSLVPIRATDMGEAWLVMKGMAGMNGFGRPPEFREFTFAAAMFPTVGELHNALFLNNTVLLLCLLGIVLFAKNSMDIVKTFRPNGENLLFVSLLFIIAVPNVRRISEFIYFQF